MQADFHYYATYAAAFLAGFDYEDCVKIAYSAQFVDLCSKTMLNKLKAKNSAATTQLQLEMMDMRTDPVGLAEITRIWSSFHFLPYDLNGKLKGHSKFYRNKYNLMCNPNGELLVKTVNLAKSESAGVYNLEAIGLAMHVLADTWAHRYFVGTPSYVMNNTNDEFYEVRDDGISKINFVHIPGIADDLEKMRFSNSLHQSKETTIMNLGHGRAGHLPDYSFITYRYIPSWNGYASITKNNPEDYYKAFCQMVYAMRYYRGDIETFEADKYAYDIVEPYKEEINSILRKRQMDASEDWKAFSEKLSGKFLPDWKTDDYEAEYMNASINEKNDTLIGKFIIAALKQKQMVTEEIFNSGSMLAGIPFSLIFKMKSKKSRGKKS